MEGPVYNLTCRFPQASQIPYEHLEVFVPPHVDVQTVEVHLRMILDLGI